MRGLPTLQDLFDPRGRSSRAGLMKVAALLMAADLVLVAVLAATGASFAGPAAVAFKLASVWLATVGVARRLHDLDLSAWWLAKALAALIGWSILVSFSLLSTYTAAQVLDPAGRVFWLNLAATTAPVLVALAWLHMARGSTNANRYGSAPGASGFSCIGTAPAAVAPAAVAR